MIKTLVLTSHKCLESTPNPTPPPLAQLHHTWAFVHVGEYVRIIYALVSSTIVTPSDETTGFFCLLHPLAKVDFLPFVDDFHLKIKVILDQETFIFTLVRSPHLYSSGPLGMVYEFLQNYFFPNDFANGFDFFFEIRGHIVRGQVPPSDSHLFFSFQILMLEK